MVYLSNYCLIIIISVFLFTSINSQSNQFPLINDERTQNTKFYCKQTRQQITNQQQMYDYQFMQTSTKNSFSINGFDFISILLQGGNISQTVEQNRGNFVVYFGFFVIPCAILILIIPFLLCCLICPNSCPLTKSKSQDTNARPYTKCELIYPPLSILFLLLMLLAALIYAITYQAPLTQSYDNSFCSVSIFLDNLLNGNISLENPEVYWIGTHSTQKSLEDIRNSFSEIQTITSQINSSSSTVLQIQNELSDNKQKLNDIPKQQIESYQYNTPFSSAIPLDTIQSNFLTILGNTTQIGSLIFNTSLSIDATSLAINAVVQIADAVQQASNKAQSAITDFINEIANINSEIRKIDESLQSDNQIADDIFKTLITIFYLIVIIGIVASVFLFISTVFILCCKKYKCRYLLYVACSLLLIMGIVYFLLAIIFSIITPVAYYGCDYLQTGFGSPQNFTVYFSPILTADVSEAFSQCALSGNGKIVQELIGQQTLDYLQNVRNLIQETSTYEKAFFSKLMNDSSALLSQTINQYMRAQILDFDDQNSLQVLQQLADFPGVCSSLDGDSWIPSVSQNPIYVSCSVQNGLEVTQNQCPDITTKVSCSGCIDTYSVLRSYSSVITLKSDLDARYGTGEQCQDFTTALSNTWNNFYNKKQNLIEDDLLQAQKRQQQINNIDLSPISQAFQNVNSELASTIGLISDPKIGLIAGLNCKVLGEDIVLVTRTVCNSTFSFSFVQRILFGIAGWIILILSCFSVCLGVRSYRMQTSSYYQQNNQKGFSLKTISQRESQERL